MIGDAWFLIGTIYFGSEMNAVSKASSTSRLNIVKVNSRLNDSYMYFLQ